MGDFFTMWGSLELDEITWGLLEINPNFYIKKFFDFLWSQLLDKLLGRAPCLNYFLARLNRIMGNTFTNIRICIVRIRFA